MFLVNSTVKVSGTEADSPRCSNNNNNNSIIICTEEVCVIYFSVKIVQKCQTLTSNKKGL